MRRRIRTTPANIAAVALIVTILGAWLGVLLLRPGDHTYHAAASNTSTVTSADHQHGGPPGSVADRIVAESESMKFCISATLEPFDGAVAQIREIGPAEPSERFRRCLLDTMFDHASDETIAELELHRPHFLVCFGDLATEQFADKASTVESTLECLEKIEN